MLDLESIVIAGLALAVFSVPLTVGWIPRNPLYGFRVPATMRDERVWYAVNKRFGLEAIIVGTGLAILATLLDASGLDTRTVQILANVALLAAVLAMLIRGWRTANALAGNRQQP